MIQAQNVLSEKDLCADLELRLSRLSAEGRCEWRKEVRMLCFAHAKDGGPRTLRVDFAAKIDGILIGLEVKASPQTGADLGRCLTQCAEYSRGVVGAATPDRVPQEWVGQPFLATFFVSDSTGAPPSVIEHAQYAQRLFGPSNVGFLRRHYRFDTYFELFLCADRAWSREWGWHRGLINKTARVGNGSVRVADVSGFKIPESAYPFRYVEGTMPI